MMFWVMIIWIMNNYYIKINNKNLNQLHLINNLNYKVLCF